MKVTSIFRSDLVVKSIETAREFYRGVKECITIPYNSEYVIRVEPGNLIGIISKLSIADGTAWMIPNVYDDGLIAYRYRKYINAYLRRE